jgi:hypothetical protein
MVGSKKLEATEAKNPNFFLKDSPALKEEAISKRRITTDRGTSVLPR